MACPNEDKTIENGILTASLTPSEEATMRQLLEAFERSGPWQITVEMRFLEAPVQFLQTIDWAAGDDNTHVRRILDQPQEDKEALWRTAFTVTESNRDDASRPSDAAGISAAVPILTTKIRDSEYHALIDLCQGDNRANHFQTPKPTLFNGQVAAICDVAPHAFVTDLTVVPSDHGAAFYPKIALRDEGWRMFIQAVVVDTERVDVRCAFSQSHIREVWSANLPYRAVPNQPDEGAEIQVPLVQTDTIAVQSRLSPGQTLLVCSPKPYSPKVGSQPSVRVLALRARPISDMECVRHFIQHLDPGE
ncbi:MAG: hypothetical protein O2931_14555 [Planctomycetota bacterium]|nr:hypothetical protein [Planctomycetota bacterium]MDA1180006.1 hypothetical protein [Planctomycetota bacterium]